MRFLTMCCLAVAVMVAGCSDSGAGSITATEPHPFALTERLEAVGTRQAAATEASSERLEEIGAQSARTNGQLGELLKATESTNALLGQLIDQQQLAAGQQCDLLDKLSRDGDRDSRDHDHSKEPSPLSMEAVEGELFPDDIHIIVDGVQSPLSEFVEKWYRNPWREASGTIDDCLARFGVAAEHIQRLSGEAKEKLHGAIHEHQQSREGAEKPVPQNKGQEEAIRFKNRVVERGAMTGLPVVPQLAKPPCPNGICPQRPVQQWSFGSVVRRRRR